MPVDAPDCIFAWCTGDDERVLLSSSKCENPINNADIIYTPGVTVFKTDTSNPKLLDEKDWYDVDVITCAAPNLRERPSNRFNW